VARIHLRRYTNMPSLIYLLAEKKITLLDPESWDDKNDSHFLSLYREKKKLRSVLALCFSYASETYHHWRVFAHGSSGVCVSFKRTEFINEIKKQPGLRMGTVEYLRLNEIRHKQLEVDGLPFLKRYPFQGESEFRVIYESKKADIPTLDISIPLSCIYKITLSPWLPRSLSDRVKARCIPYQTATRSRSGDPLS